MTRPAFIVLLGLMLILCGGARAQTLDAVTSEDVAIAFNKIAGIKPNFATWAEDTQVFHDTPFARRPLVRDQEMARLQQSYDVYSPEQSLLNLVTNAVVQVKSMTTDPKHPNKTEYIIAWQFATDNGNLFPYEYRKTLYALVPNKIEDFQQAMISRDEFDFIRGHLGTSNNARVSVQIRGTQADGSAPMHLYDQDIWVLGGLVASVTLWDQDNNVLWEKTASWYSSPRSKGIEGLYYDQRGP